VKKKTSLKNEFIFDVDVVVVVVVEEEVVI